MPPRKRIRKSDQKLSTSDPTSTEPTATVRPEVPAGSNTGQIFDLPAEIWLEILSHFPSVRIPTLRISASPLLPAATLSRQQALRALSQTCRGLRAFFLPELWDRFEVCATPGQVESSTTFGEDQTALAPENKSIDIAGAWYKAISQSLEIKSDGLRQSPELAKLVHKVSVALTRCSAASVLRAFVQCLHVLPNAHTLQILRAHTQMTTHLKNAFEGHKFPQIQTIVLPSHAHNILRCCPEVKSVCCNYDDGGKLVSAIAKECKKVERLEGFKPDEKMMKRLVKAVPNLREIKFACRVTPKELVMLSSLKHICSIELAVAQPDPDQIKQDLELMACIKLAREILRKAPGKPWLGLRHERTTWQGTTFWTKELEVSTE